MLKQILHYATPIGKLIVFAACFFICILPVGLVQQIPAIKVLEDVNSTLLLETLLIFSVFGALWMLKSIFKQLTFQQVFLLRNNVLNGFLRGILFGVVVMAICVGTMALLGIVSFEIGTISIDRFFFYVCYFLVVALFEELVFRSYPLFVFADCYPILPAILINGILFGLVHAANPGFTWLAMLNISLAGMLFSMFTLYYRNISWAIGIHLGWNFAQGILFGYHVSGTKTPSLLSTHPHGKYYLSGGEFGIEGSLICTIVLTLMIIYFFIKYKIEPLKVYNKKPLVDEFTRTR